MESEYPLAVVSKRTGLSPQLIRTWEIRHAAVSPRRSGNGRRLYSVEDVERLHLLRRLTTEGFSIGRIARLPMADLEELLAQQSSAAPVLEGPDDPAAAPFVSDAMDAIGRLDGDALIRALEAADLRLGKPVFLQEVVGTVARQVGEAWQSGRLKIVHEHFATAQIRGYLGPFGRVPHQGPATPHLIVTTPAGQWHELGALLVAAAAHSNGWRVTYLGPSVPVEEIAGGALGYNARAVALSIVHPEDDPQVAHDLRRLRRLLPETIALLIGGRGSSVCAPIVSGPGVSHLSRLDELYPALDELRRQSPLQAFS